MQTGDGAMNMMCGKVQREPQVHQQLSEQEKVIDVLFGRVCELRDLLSSVLRDMPVPTGQEGKDRTCMAPLAERIFLSTDKARACNMVVSDMIERLEL